jgi:hypothetical protein
MVVETTQQYMARKGLKAGAVIGASPTPVLLETTEEYMARKGLELGDPLTDPAAVAVVVETQEEHAARKAAEAAPKATRAKK